MNGTPSWSASAAVRSFEPTRPSRSSTAGQRLIRALGLFDRVLEAVTRKHVTIDERLSEATNLVDEQDGSPVVPTACCRGIGRRPDSLKCALETMLS